MLRGAMRKRVTLVAFVVLAALASTVPADAAPVPIPASLQWRGHLPELGARPSVRLFQTAAQYETFRRSLSDPSLFPPADRLFMSFDRDVLALYARGEDVGGRCLRTGSSAALDGTVALDLSWLSGTCGAPSTARHPFILVSLSRTASDGTAWVQPSTQVCAAPPGVDPRACGSFDGGAAVSPSPTPATTPSPSPSPATGAPSPSPAPATASASPAPPTPSPSPVATTLPPTVAPSVALASPTPARSPDPTPRPVDVPTDDTVNYLLWGALGLIVVFVIVAALFARSPRR